MAELVLESLSLRWTVRIPTRPPWPDSESFDLAGDEVYLHCYVNRRRKIFLNLIWRNFVYSNLPWYCRVSVENSNTGRILFAQSIEVDDTTLHWINIFRTCRINVWQQHTQDIEEVDFDFSSTRELTFTLTWRKTPFDPSFFVRHIRHLFGINHLEPTNSSSESSSISSSSEKCTNDVSVQTSSCKNQSLESLLDDFAKLLDEDSNPDVELHCEGHIIKAHKAILSVRSSVLKIMLQTDMVEGRTGVVNIKDMAVDTFRSFVRYLYIGKLDALSFDSALHLYEAGDMYRVESLSRRCSEYLIENLNVENSYDALVVADAHSDSNLVDVVIAYMVGKKVPMSGDSWRAFCDAHAKLANQVLSRMCEKLLK